MKTKLKTAAICLTLSLFSTLSFAECGMDRKLELLKELEAVKEEREMLISSNRNDKWAELKMRELKIRERDALYEYEVVCNVE